ncbi:hypothetical protein [Denitromonas ohlonensis]|uniref:Lytic murein transglycosylase n=2 Tax=Denitromonas TaxID=139331 RepID=A0A558CIA3_9RHOO|nr:hypothetical protein [Denitromonas ohlonensis]TVO69436.1 hypothetical protein FHP90_02330 [Denitromonas ohlonensis]TVO77536.1 hypothetical protein FHP89_09560 [Denitromonas ohlonensis]TVT48488.1 MAG: hypothetical protein FHP94_10180 [Denitromonas halophila]TVT73069.1 MAG: hypothetical protein FHP93_06735 [Denitromonas halophila]
MKLIVAILSLIVLAILAPLAFMPSADDIHSQQSALPWQIEVDAQGRSKVFGLTLEQSTLGEARERFGLDLTVAIVTAPGETGALEAYLSSAQLGFVTGKLVLTIAVAGDELDRMRQRAVKTEYMESTTRKATLSAADLATAMTRPIDSIVFIPSVNLDEEAVLSRFGAPSERVATNAHQTHLLYPDKGLDLIVDTEGKEILQYVAPRSFARVHTPLRAAVAQ